jgi:hypothetical protein
MWQYCETPQHRVNDAESVILRQCVLVNTYRCHTPISQNLYIPSCSRHYPNHHLTLYLTAALIPSFKMIAGIVHVNLTVPAGTFSQAEAFYANTLGMTRVPVPVEQKNTLAW